MLYIFFSGPGLQDPETATMQYLENVAIDVARGLSAGTVKVPERKHSFQESNLMFMLIP